MAGVTLVPSVIKAIVATANAHLTNTTVYRGPGNPSDDEPLNQLFVGINDVYTADWTVGANSNQQWATLGAQQRDDNGEVWCTAYSWNGDSDSDAAMDAAYGTVAALEAALRADVTLGNLPGVLWVGVTTTELRETQDSGGARAQVIFTVAYRGRI
ncbi:MAG: hypothetical protein ACXVXO_00325 [Mycobacteriaceae bacterium]